MSKVSSLLKKWTETSLVLRILGGLVIGAVLGLVCPQWTGIGILGKVFVSALKAIAPILVALLVAASIAKAKGGLEISAILFGSCLCSRELSCSEQKWPSVQQRPLLHQVFISKEPVYFSE